MKKIVIADDDFLVRTYLKQMLPWEEMGFVVAGDARNGKEALTLVQQEQPTLLITDICMPVMNGIDLIKELKAAGRSVHILVLSCHDDFAYVKEAMQLGIDDYILKTDLTPEKMEEFLSRCVQASEGEVSETLGTDDLVRIGRGKLRQDFFAAFTRGVGEDELRALARAGGIDPEIQLAGAMLIHIRDWGRRRQELSSDGFASFCRAFHDLCRDLCGRDGTVLRMELFQPVEEAADWGLLADYTLRGGSAHADRALQEMAAKLRHMMERYLGVETIIVTAASVRSLVALQDVWRSLYAERVHSFMKKRVASLHRRWCRREPSGQCMRRRSHVLCGRCRKAVRKRFGQRRRPFLPSFKRSGSRRRNLSACCGNGWRAGRAERSRCPCSSVRYSAHGSRRRGRSIGFRILRSAVLCAIWRSTAMRSFLKRRSPIMYI